MFNTFIYTPLYNALVFLIDTLPGASVGMAVIVLTVLVKIILLPLAYKVARTQVVVKHIQPEIDALQKEFKEDKQQLTLKTLELYKKHRINPLLGIVVLIVQLPIVFGLYWVFYKGGLPEIHTDALYSFVRGDIVPNMHFLGLIDMGARNAPLAFLVGITQFMTMRIVMPEMPKVAGSEATFKEDFARSMHIQMKYILPFIMTSVAYFVSAAVSLYWLTSNVFSIGQELLVRKQMSHE